MLLFLLCRNAETRSKPLNSVLSSATGGVFVPVGGGNHCASECRSASYVPLSDLWWGQYSQPEPRAEAAQMGWY